jgi:hypothetical protein
MTTKPLMLANYRVRCCGTCKHRDDIDNECKFDNPNYVTIRSKYSICSNLYEPKEY